MTDKPQDETTPAPEASLTPDEAAALPVVDPVDELKKQLADLNERHLRTLAEYDNYRKRSAREMAEIRLNVRAATLQEFINVFDYFAMAMDHAAAPDVKLEVIRQGMQMIFTQYQGLLDNLGVTPFDVTGKKFDPAEQEAVSQEHSATVPAGMVLRQWKRGYRIGDRLVRPATVVVSAGPEPQPAATETTPPAK
jgi:molecular chaperone GrpE